MLEELEKWSHLKQQVLPFDFWEEEKAERQEEIHNLPFYENPQNDNQLLFNLQKEYYEGSEKALTEMFRKLMEIAPKLINVEIQHADGKRKYTKTAKNEMALDAVCLFIEQIKKNELIITKSFVAYLRLQVLKVMNTVTKSMLFENYCKKHNINLFTLSEAEKFSFKMRFELELRRKSMTEQEVWMMMQEAELLNRELPALSEKEREVEKKVFCQKWYGISLEEALRLGA